MMTLYRPADEAKMPHQQAGLVCFHAFLQRLLNVDCAADPVLCGPEWQLHLQQHACMSTLPLQAQRLIPANSQRQPSAAAEISERRASGGQERHDSWNEVAATLAAQGGPMRTSGVFTLATGSSSPLLKRSRASGPIILGSLGLELKASSATTSISGNRSTIALTCTVSSGALLGPREQK